jgi:hypothetical protein
MKRTTFLVAALSLFSIGISAKTWDQLVKEEKIQKAAKFHYQSLLFLADSLGFNGEQIAELEKIQKDYQKSYVQLRDKSVMDPDDKAKQLMELRTKRNEALAKMMGADEFHKFEDYVTSKMESEASPKQ